MDTMVKVARDSEAGNRDHLANRIWMFSPLETIESGSVAITIWGALA